jgi:hypothetical protein
MTSKLSNIRRFFILLSVVWFAGYASATAVCANSCPDCESVSTSVNSCNASCSAAGVISQNVVKVKLPKPAVQSIDIFLIYASVDTANIWKPPKQVVPFSSPFVI